MRHALRILFHASAVLSLILGLGVIVAGVRSYFVQDAWVLWRSHYLAWQQKTGILTVQMKQDMLMTRRGGLLYRRRFLVHADREDPFGFTLPAPDPAAIFEHESSPAAKAYPQADPGRSRSWLFLGFDWHRGHDNGSFPAEMDTLFVLPMWFFALITLSPAVAWLWRWRVRRIPGRCAQCGYDLRATPDRCPECGAAVAESHTFET